MKAKLQACRALALAAACVLCRTHAEEPSSCVTDPFSWTTFQVHVIAAPGDANGTAAKEILQSRFCREFGLSPCAVTDGGEGQLSISDDLTFDIPRANFSGVLPWLLQARWSHVLGSNGDLDLLLHPVSGCGSTVDSSNFSAGVGERFPFSPNHLYTSSSSSSDSEASMVSEAKRDEEEEKEDELWAAECSSDCSDDDLLCMEPYANHTTCSAASSVQAYHVHFSYFQNSNRSIYGKEDLFGDLATDFGLSWYPFHARLVLLGYPIASLLPLRSPCDPSPSFSLLTHRTHVRHMFPLKV